jgi:O-acetyl-ADP-ribose deacetylase (regulator of RNase III)
MNARGKSESHNNAENQDPNLNRFSVLINPGNPSLSGVSKFAYFPVGGPEPPPSFSIGKDSHPIMGYVTSWGGMEVGNGMSFASNTVDGLVHQFGGRDLQRECETSLSNTWTGGMGRLDEGEAIPTPAVGTKLKEASGYELLVHTVPPFVDQDHRSRDGKTTTSESGEKAEKEGGEDEVHEHNNFLLAECYRNSLRTAALVSPSSSPLKIACPLLGAGCRGFPTERAIRIAALASTDWMIKAVTTDAIEKKETTANEDENCRSGSVSMGVVPSRFSLVAGWFGRGGERSRDFGNWESLEEQSHQSITLAFGIPDGEIRKQLIEAIDREMELQIP